MALTGQEKGMRLYDILLILGRREVLRRLGVKDDGRNGLEGM
jgi:glutamyl-tRNA synthetase